MLCGIYGILPQVALWGKGKLCLKGTTQALMTHRSLQTLVVFQKVCLGRRLQIPQICKYSDSCFQIHTPRRVDLIFVL